MKHAYHYILAFLPGQLFLGLGDVQKKFLIQMNYPGITMKSQIFGTVTSVLWNYIFVIKLNWGVVGTGFSFTITTFLVWIINMIYTKCLKDVDVIEARKIHFFDSQVYRSIWQYLKISLPNMFLMFLDWSSFEIMTLISGSLGFY